VPAITGVPDAMSDVLSLVRMRAEVVCANEYSAPWSFGFPLPMAHFHIVERGTAWLSVDQREPVRLEMGDLAILPLGTGHVLGNDPGVPPVPIDEAMRSAAVRHGAAVYQLGGGGERTHVLCGRFSFAGVLAPKLLTVLPPLIHIETRSGGTPEWLRLTSHFLIEETRDPKPGSAIMLARLLDVLFVQAVREWERRAPTISVGSAASMTLESARRCQQSTRSRPAPGPSSIWPRLRAFHARHLRRASPRSWAKHLSNTSPAGGSTSPPSICAPGPCGSARSLRWSATDRKPR
jgi:hypothetical protein